MLVSSNRALLQKYLKPYSQKSINHDKLGGKIYDNENMLFSVQIWAEISVQRSHQVVKKRYI